MSVGNRLLDDDHKKLIGMISRIEAAMRTRNSGELSLLLTGFEFSMRTHFSNEEALARAIGHAFDNHRAEHEYVLNELGQMKKEVLSPDGKWSESASAHYLYFLGNWASEHISQDDMLMKPGLESLPYDFRPTEPVQA